jgi:hypothetical protein
MNGIENNSAAFSLGQLLGKGFILVLLIWGARKCIVVADRPTTNAKCAYSLAIVLVALGLPFLGVPSITRRLPALY